MSVAASTREGSPLRALDHVAIPIENVDAMLRFYDALGFTVRTVQPSLFYSAHFGDSKINFHAPKAWRSERFTLRGPAARPGCGDFCFVWGDTLAALEDRLAALAIPVLEGPVPRAGGRGETGASTYIRDPDGNLLEFIVY